jgi:hypothetical protein
MRSYYDRARPMLDQLIRQEALDGYADRWLGEVSWAPKPPQCPVLLLGVAAVAAIVALLVCGSYTQMEFARGVFTGPNEEITITARSVHLLQVGQPLRLDVTSPVSAGERLEARVASLTPVARLGGPVFRIGLRLPLGSQRAAGTTFLVYVPLQRRRLYQWVFRYNS